MIIAVSSSLVEDSYWQNSNSQIQNKNFFNRIHIRVFYTNFYPNLSLIWLCSVLLAVVRSYGTEGRKGNPAEEIPPSDNVFDYIVFRGSDVKDLHVCEAPAPPPPSLPPQVPNDPAILGVS